MFRDLQERQEAGLHSGMSCLDRSHVDLMLKTVLEMSSIESVAGTGFTIVLYVAFLPKVAISRARRWIQSVKMSVEIPRHRTVSLAFPVNAWNAKSASGLPTTPVSAD